MFSPAELLNNIWVSFNKVGVPDAGNVRLGKRTARSCEKRLGDSRSNDSGRFNWRRPQPFANATSEGISSLYDEFSAFVEATMLRDATMR